MQKKVQKTFFYFLAPAAAPPELHRSQKVKKFQKWSKVGKWSKIEKTVKS